MAEALLTPSMIRKSHNERSLSTFKPGGSVSNVSRAILASSVTLTVDLGNMSQSLLQTPNLDNRGPANISFPIAMQKSQSPNELLTLPEALDAPSRLRSSSFSRTCSDAANTVSKTGITASKSFSLVSKTLSRGKDKLLRRKSFIDLNLPHCQQKAFKDGATVQMIGGLMPPRIPFSEVNTDVNSSNMTTGIHDGNKRNAFTSSALKSLSCASLAVMISTPNPAIDSDMDELTSCHPSDSMDKTGKIRKSESSLSRKHSKPSEVDDSRLMIATPPTKLYGPRISASIMPHLDPIALSDLLSGSEDQPSNEDNDSSSIGNSLPYNRPGPEVHKSGSTTTVVSDTACTVSQISDLGNGSDDDHTPPLTASADTSDNEEGDKTVTQIITTGDFSFVSARMGTALKNFITDLGRGSMDTAPERSMSTNGVVDTTSCWVHAHVSVDRILLISFISLGRRSSY
ncbi:hypothetical protein FRC20_004463 [Serendipita sp. 405]|nr:hypothetical protein FRC20_004463 [Serendipita sp. 405]